MNTCETCGTKFTPTRNSKGRFCSKECSVSGQRERGEVQCARLECSVTFMQKSKGQMFCSQSCSAKVNNVRTPKRSPEGTCQKCESPRSTHSGRRFCPECWKSVLEERLAARVSDPRPKEKRTSPLSFCKCGDVKSSKAKMCGTCRDKTRPTLQKWKDGSWNGSTAGGAMKRKLRDLLLEDANYRCQSPTCPVPGGFGGMVNPVTGNVPLEVDHIDGDCHNNTPENLIVLCPTCHALTPTYRALNKNSKRSSRRKAGNLTPTV